MILRRFKDVITWQKAQDFAVDIYLTFKGINDFAFKDRICRAVNSISNNIAEGFDRSSKTDFSRFVFIAISSCSEARSMQDIAFKLNYISEEQLMNYIEKSNEASKITRGLIKSY